jgi:thioredoxin 1
MTNGFKLSAVFLFALAVGFPALALTPDAPTVKITPDNFKAEVLKSKMPVMVDVGATWCVPCHLLAPTVEKLSNVYAGKLKVAEMDADQNSDLVGQLGIQAFPTLLFYKNGKVVKTLIGTQSEKDLRLEIDHLLKSAQKVPLKPS